MAIHKATPQREKFPVSTCDLCGRDVKQVPGGQGLIWVHSATGHVVAEDLA